MRGKIYMNSCIIWYNNICYINTIIKKIRDGKRSDGRSRRPRIREAIKKKVVKKIVYDSSSCSSDRDSDLCC